MKNFLYQVLKIQSCFLMVKNLKEIWKNFDSSEMLLESDFSKTSKS